MLLGVVRFCLGGGWSDWGFFLPFFLFNGVAGVVESARVLLLDDCIGRDWMKVFYYDGEESEYSCDVSFTV